jgi:hypothetical protein
VINGGRLRLTGPFDRHDSPGAPDHGVGSDLSIQTPARHLARLGNQDAIRQGAARPPAPIIDRTEDPDVAAGIAIPDSLDLDLVLPPGTPSNLYVMPSVDQGS